MTDRTPVIALDPQAIINRRRELTMSRNDLARRADLSVHYLERLEAGEDQSFLTLAVIGALAAALAVDPRQLYLTPEPDELPNPDQAIADLAAIFLEDAGPFRVEAIARYLDTTLDTATHVLHELDRRLNAAGLALHHGNDGIRLVAATIADTDRLRPERHRDLTAGTLPPGVIGLIHRAIDTPLRLDPRAHHRIGPRWAISHGLLHYDDEAVGDTVTLSDDVRFALLLDDEPALD